MIFHILHRDEMCAILRTCMDRLHLSASWEVVRSYHLNWREGEHKQTTNNEFENLNCIDLLH